MTETAKALYAFYSGFGVPAYTENTVPDDAEPPYITYNVPETEWSQSATHYANIWSRSTSNAEVMALADAIKAAITPRAMLQCDGGGYVALRPGGGPLIQLMTSDEPEIRRAYVNMQINCYHM